jgi:putative SOS response-associated peptidase YedK
MCGRYRLSRKKEIIEQYFESAHWDDDWNPRYNIAPTQAVPVIRQHPTQRVRQLALMKWGLVPHWAKDASIAMNTINAKSETAATKPAFRDPFRLRRCLIPADGFYEWQRTAASKQPYCFEVGGGELFAFAGLWDGWKDSNGRWVKTCSILTTTPNTVTATVHDRMPVILGPSSGQLIPYSQARQRYKSTIFGHNRGFPHSPHSSGVFPWHSSSKCLSETLIASKQRSRLHY